MNYASLLKNKKAKIAVWGCGFIGLSTLLHYANKGIKSVGFDTNLSVVEALKNNKFHIHNIESWINFPTKGLLKSNLINFTNNYEEILNDKDIICHFIAVPTEKNGRPFLEPIKWVLNKKSKSKNNFLEKKKFKPSIIIESTLVPKTTDKYLKKIFDKNKSSLDDFFYCVAPRRDWFETKDKTLTSLNRVFGCNSDKAKKQIINILKIVSKNVCPASSYKVSEFVKAFENSYRHLDITLANQLAFAFPKDNVREALKLAGTKWNMNTYYPGFGTGGYCIPLSSQYVLEGAEKNSKVLTLLRETVKFDKNVNRKIAKKIILKNPKKILILGLSYKSDVKVSILSPSIDLYNFFKKKKIQVDIYDPLFKKDELKKILNCRYLNDFNLSNYDTMIFMINHKAFQKKIKSKIKRMKNLKIIMDNTGNLKKFENLIQKKNCELLITGKSNWLN